MPSAKHTISIDASLGDSAHEEEFGAAASRGDAPQAHRRKLPWQSPSIRSGHLFESNSLACGKNTPQLDQCLQNPLNS